ncbi:MAG TPA: hypothetical protein PKZ69_00045 [Candidatus Cloacimonadota bacterium]|jgi:uncharacterized membrane protein|nr:hypothetical protein [Candidatus Cloacimonadales bacterium]HOE90344.1 hypothetical protein [Candidatus Cloacimonadota bacterium]HOQ79448.1 hypothetical protein [Candidatus Cloacimonadota bacterium]HPK39982.1 hypothetical protein [Candidatus Cloacimonadota bacterium]
MFTKRFVLSRQMIHLISIVTILALSSLCFAQAATENSFGMEESEATSEYIQLPILLASIIIFVIVLYLMIKSTYFKSEIKKGSHPVSAAISSLYMWLGISAPVSIISSLLTDHKVTAIALSVLFAILFLIAFFIKPDKE